MNPHLSQTYADLHFEDVRAYLEHKGWEFRERHGSGEEWEQDGDRVLLATVPSSGEYSLRMSELVKTLAHREGRGRADVLRDIAGVRSNRISYPGTQDTVLIPSDLLNELKQRGWEGLEDALAEVTLTNAEEHTRQILRYNMALRVFRRLEAHVGDMLIPQSATSEPPDFWSGRLHAAISDLINQLEELPYRKTDD